MVQLSKRPADQWVPVQIDATASIEIFITRPTYEVLVEFLSEFTTRRRIALRLEAITDWRGVEDEGEPVPFTADALADLFHTFPDALTPMLAAVRPFFEAPETQLKNSAAPPAAATTPKPPLVDSTPIADLQPSALPSA